MKCDICNENEAVISLRQVSTDNKVSEIHLCMDCAHKRGCVTPEADGTFDAASKFQGDNVKAIFQKISKEIADRKNRECPVCGQKYMTIVREQKVGCPECYSVFARDIHSELKKLGVDGQYTGTCANTIPDFRSVLVDRANLQRKLDEAVENEEYEKAALYRDQLKLLDKKAISGEEE